MSLPRPRDFTGFIRAMVVDNVQWWDYSEVPQRPDCGGMHVGSGMEVRKHAYRISGSRRPPHPLPDKMWEARSTRPLPGSR